MLAYFKKNVLVAEDDRLKKIVRQVLREAALEDLEDAFPDWRKITGAPTDDRSYIDLSVPFRKWLSTKEPAYQRRVTHTEAATIIRRSIEQFYAATAKPPP